MIYAVLLLLGSLTGGSNPLQPLASVNLGSGGTMVAEDRHIEFQRIKTVDDLDRELAAAASAGKTVMLDFYADWCVSCIEMEEYTFTDPGVQAALAETVLLQADVTKNDAEDKALLERFDVNRDRYSQANSGGGEKTQQQDANETLHASSLT